MRYLSITGTKFAYFSLVAVFSLLLFAFGFLVRSNKTSFAAETVTKTVTYNEVGTYDIANQVGTQMGAFSSTRNWIGTEGNTANSFLGMRFTGEAIPANAQIQSASFTVTSSKTLTEKLSINVFAEKVAMPQPYTPTQLISARVRTAASNNFTATQKWTLNQKFTFNALAPVQELVASGNGQTGVINIIAKGASAKWDYWFVFNQRTPAKAPFLTITYTIPGDVTPTIIPSATPTAPPSPTPDPQLSPTTIPTAPVSSPTPTPLPQTGGIWKPTPDKPISWHWQLTDDFVYPRDVVPGATVYDIDGEKATAQTVAQLHALGPDVKVICYFDAGVYETYRSDASMFPASVIGSKDVGWDGSFWLDIRQQDILLPIMRHRMIDWCKNKGFDAIEPDETEVWSNASGFPITKAQNNSYNIAIANMAHELGMSIGLKGNTTEASDLWSYFDFSINEQCWQYSECDNMWNNFIAHGKAVFNIEYSGTPNCTSANSHHMNSAKRDLNLVGPTSAKYLYQPCRPNGSTSWQ